MEAATAEALAEGRSSVVTTNNAKIFDCLKRLAQHLDANVEIVERDGLTDLIFRPPPRSTSTTASPLPTRSAVARRAMTARKAQPASRAVNSFMIEPLA